MFWITFFMKLNRQQTCVRSMNGCVKSMNNCCVSHCQNRLLMTGVRRGWKSLLNRQYRLPLSL